FLDQSAARIGSPQVRHFSGVPHAVFEALFRTTPGGRTLSGFDPLCSSLLRSGAYPPLSGLGRSARSMARCTLGPPCPAGDAHQARRDRAASAVPAGCACCTLPGPPPPIRTYERLRRRPSWIEAGGLSGRILPRA